MKNRLVILGAGESGVGAAILGKKEDYAVFVSDLGKLRKNIKTFLSEYDIEFEEGIHSEDKILQAEFVVKSPGIPDTAPLIKNLKEKSIPVISEIEFAGKYNRQKQFALPEVTEKQPPPY